MDWGVIGAVAGVAAIFVALWIHRRQNPAKRVRITRFATSLVAENDRANDVVVTLNDTAMVQPHVVDVTIGASGASDIGESSFNNRQIVLNLGVKIRKNLTPESVKYRLRVLSDTQVGLDPVVLKRPGKGPSYSGRFLCEGSPVFEVPTFLEHVDIEEGEPADFQGLEIATWRTLVWMLVLAVMAGAIVGGILGNEGVEAAFDWISNPFGLND